MDHLVVASSSRRSWHHTAWLHRGHDFLKGVVREVLFSLDHVDLAAKEGKALDQLQERIRGSHIDAEVRLEDTRHRQDHGKHIATVRVETTEPLPREVRSHINYLVAMVRRRVQMEIRSEFVIRDDPRMVP